MIRFVFALVVSVALGTATGCSKPAAGTASIPKADHNAPAPDKSYQPDPRLPRGLALQLDSSNGFDTLSVTDAGDGVTQLEIAYASDDLRVRGFLFYPAGEGVHPAVLFNHGGVSGVSADMKRRSKDLAMLGYVVLAPAYRGEGGSEGRVEVAAGEVDDVLAAADLLRADPRVDGTRLAVTGSSHGALISVLAAARRPDVFRCVVEACGVMDVVSWYHYLVENEFDVSDSLSVAVYGHGPLDKPEAFRVRQAIRVAPRLTMPVLLQQGGADRIVPPEQARLFADVLADLGHSKTTLLEYPLLGHAFWFWDDLRYHTAEEIAEADRAWSDFTAFLSRNLLEP